VRISRVVGTAGHIDHGKTALVKALTGVDTDRLPEEKEREISIDLGFAPIDLPGGVRAAVVDVPGHERFVKNMLAGVGGIDAVLFTIAADEGVMPQTSEHLEILHYLGVRAGVVVLTKSDLVDEEMIELVREEVEETLRGTTLEGAPIIAASALTGMGLEEVARTLVRVLEEAPARPDPGFFRQPVDRVFSSRGFGTVVTGTVWSGSARVGDRLLVLPRGAEVRIRKIEVFSEEVEEARPGQRTALALHGVSREEVARGDVLVTPKILLPTHMIDARFSLARSAKAIRNRQRIRFHHGAAEVLGRVVLLESETMAPGSEAFVQVRLEGPIVVARGDRFIVRTYSPARTIGGGTVLDANPSKRKGAGRSDLDFLAVSEAGDRGEMIRSILRSSGKGTVAVAEIARRLQVLEGEAQEALRALEKESEVRFLGAGVLLEETASSLKREIEERVERVSARDPLRAGVPREEIRRGLSREVDLSLFQVLLGEMAEAGRVTVRGEMVLAGGGALPEKVRVLAEKVEGILERHRLAPPLPAQIAEEAGVDGRELQAVLDLLARLGRIVKVTPGLVYRRAEIDEIRSLLRGVLREKGALSVSDFKEKTGVSRKYAVPLLEYFDRERWTRREGDLRVPGPAFDKE